MHPIVSGSCRCGETRFKVAGQPMATFACHCTGCQKMTSSAFSLSSLYPDAALTITAGNPVIGALRNQTEHSFCPDCHSWLFSRPKALPGLVNIRATLLDNAATFRPFIETWTSEMLPWASTGAKHSFPGFPDPERFPSLLAEFANP